MEERVAKLEATAKNLAEQKSSGTVNFLAYWALPCWKGQRHEMQEVYEKMKLFEDRMYSQKVYSAF